MGGGEPGVVQRHSMSGLKRAARSSGQWGSPEPWLGHVLQLEVQCPKPLLWGVRVWPSNHTSELAKLPSGHRCSGAAQSTSGLLFQVRYACLLAGTGLAC